MEGPRLPEVLFGDTPARVVHASSTAMSVLVPEGLAGGRTPIRVEGCPGETVFVEVAAVLATGLHQVDSPIFDQQGNLYVTYSGSRGQEVPVAVFRVTPAGVREPFVTGIMNSTSMAFDRSGTLYVSSRFSGTISRVTPDGRAETFATELGVPCGLAFGGDGTLFVGDRTGTIFRVTSDGRATPFATLPSSVAAFHLAMSPDDVLYVTAPTLGAYDHVYRVEMNGQVASVYAGFGRPQGLAFASEALCVVEALAGSSGLYRLRPDGVAEQVVAAPSLVGVAFAHDGTTAVTSNETAYRLN